MFNSGGKDDSLKGKEVLNAGEKTKDIIEVDLHFNVNKMKEVFSFPKNNALKIRQLYLPHYNKNVAVLFIEGTIDTNIIDSHIIKPLLEKPDRQNKKRDFVFTILTSVLTTADAKKVSTFQDIAADLVNGNTILFIENEKSAISVETAGFENRALSIPTNETDLVGPKVAFNESAAMNRSLLRRILKNPGLVCETVTIGKGNPRDISVMYLKDVADESIVKNVKDRIEKIETDAVLSLAQVEQYLDKSPYSLFPSSLLTERPDRTASFLLEGHVILLMDNAPVSLIVPITFWSLFHTVEDQYLRMPYGNFLRIIRLTSLLIALLLPGIYIATTTFHPGMIPTDLMLSIAATRERNPFPIIIEILIMEVSFEILREAGTRVPTVLGPTIGIVGALILGQAAVQANIISPILVVIVAITGLASFAIPDIQLNISIRMLRFILLFSAGFLGVFGFSLALAILVAYLVSHKSFGVPFFAPLTPYYPSSKDTLGRPIIWKQWLRPLSMSPKDKVRKPRPKGDADRD